jgi:predicted nuclease of predicted toxin-antitoxin system
LAAAISLYLDENLSPKIARQLRLRGIDVITVRDLGHLGDSDSNHLQRATELNRVLVTADVDFLRMAQEGESHAGIVFGVQQNLTIGDWVRRLELICFVYTAADMRDHVEYL